MRYLVCRTYGRCPGLDIDILGNLVGYICLISDIFLRDSLLRNFFRISQEDVLFSAWHQIEQLCKPSSDAVQCGSAHERKLSNV